MSTEPNLTNWNEITTQEAFNLSQAEFRGVTLEALKDLKDDIQSMQRDKEIKGYINYFIAGVIGLLSGMFGSKFLH